MCNYFLKLFVNLTISANTVDSIAPLTVVKYSISMAVSKGVGISPFSFICCICATISLSCALGWFCSISSTISNMRS